VLLLCCSYVVATRPWVTPRCHIGAFADDFDMLRALARDFDRIVGASYSSPRGSPAMALHVTLFSDFICPFCYVGFRTIGKLKSEFDLEVEWRGFQIHPDWPLTGIPAEKVYGADGSAARTAAWGRISAMADAIGLAMKPPAMLTNSHHALAACEAAIGAGKGAGFEARVYRAYFFEGANIGDLEVLKNLGADVGLDRELIADAVVSPKIELRLKNNALIAHRRGVSGVPTFFIGEYPLVGAQTLDAMRKILTRASERVGAAT
jgi:predicted DsbA family dithiol-disulfide isomerase